jgi:hypothetical protein
MQQSTVQVGDRWVELSRYLEPKSVQGVSVNSARLSVLLPPIHVGGVQIPGLKSDMKQYTYTV